MGSFVEQDPCLPKQAMRRLLSAAEAPLAAVRGLGFTFPLSPRVLPFGLAGTQRVTSAAQMRRLGGTRLGQAWSRFALLRTWSGGARRPPHATLRANSSSLEDSNAWADNSMFVNVRGSNLLHGSAGHHLHAFLAEQVGQHDFAARHGCRGRELVDEASCLEDVLLADGC